MSGGGIVTLTGANTFTGGLTIKNGTVVANVSNVGTASGAAGPSGTAITLGDTGGSNPASLLANGGITVSNAINLGTTSGTLTIGNNAGQASTATFSGNIALGINNLTISSIGSMNANNAVASTVVRGVIGGTGNLTMSGTATTVIATNNNYSGTTAITAGTLQIAGTDGHFV